jgi:hypothetical protein
VHLQLTFITEIIRYIKCLFSGDTSLSLIIRGLPTNLKQKGLKDWLLPIRLKAMKVVRDANQSVVFVTFKRMPDVRRALQRNDQFFGGYKVFDGLKNKYMIFYL